MTSAGLGKPGRPGRPAPYGPWPAPAPVPADPPLLAVAHGSRDPRHAGALAALTRRVAALRPGLRVVTGHLDHCGPRVPEVIDALVADGVRTAVAVPLLLAPAFHAKHDVPAVLADPRLRIHLAATLAPSPLLLRALARRMREAGVRPGDGRYGVVLASAGSTDPEANAVTTSVAREWRRAGWCAVVPAFASVPPSSSGGPGRTTGPASDVPASDVPASHGPASDGPGPGGPVGPGSPESSGRVRPGPVAGAVRALRANGASRVVVSSCVLAPGVLPDRIVEQARAAGADVVTRPLADAPELARLVLARYDAALAAARPATGGGSPP